MKKLFITTLLLVNTAFASDKMTTLEVAATAYTSHKNQTDSTPYLAAWNNILHPNKKSIAVSRDLISKYGLTNGKSVKISVDGVALPGKYKVLDKMHPRWKNKIDIYFGNDRNKALKFGQKNVTIQWLNY